MWYRARIVVSEETASVDVVPVGVGTGVIVGVGTVIGFGVCVGMDVSAAAGMSIAE